MSSDLIFLKKKYSHLKEKALWSYRENGEGEHTRARFYSQYSHWSSNFFLLCFLLLRSIHSLSCLIRLQTFGVWECLHTSSYCEIHPKLSPHNWILPWLDLQSWETVCVMKNVHNLVSSNFLCQKPLFHECFTLKKKRSFLYFDFYLFFCHSDATGAHLLPIILPTGCLLFRSDAQIHIPSAIWGPDLASICQYSWKMFR